MPMCEMVRSRMGLVAAVPVDAVNGCGAGIGRRLLHPSSCAVLASSDGADASSAHLPSWTPCGHWPVSRITVLGGQVLSTSSDCRLSNRTHTVPIRSGRAKFEPVKATGPPKCT